MFNRRKILAPELPKVLFHPMRISRDGFIDGCNQFFEVMNAHPLSVRLGQALLKEFDLSRQATIRLRKHAHESVARADIEIPNISHKLVMLREHIT